MDEDDFESLLDAAFGIESKNGDMKDGLKEADIACNVPATQTQECLPQQYQSSSSVEASPVASPVHTYPLWAPAASPALSDASMQLHASPLHDSSSQQHDPQLLYSPVRQGSPSPEEAISPVLNKDIAILRSGKAEQQQGIIQQEGYGDRCQAGTLLHMQQQQQQTHLATATQAASRNLPSARCSQQQVSLCCLPREVQMRVLCFLSADSLTSLAQSCNQFSSLCGEPVLWRRLFVHRWGKTRGHNQAQSWKVRYMERDAAELEAAGAGAQHRDVMQDIFLQAHKAKRHKALGIGSVDDLMLVEDDEVAARVLAWRKSRGFATQQGHGTQPERPTDLAPVPRGSQGSAQHTPTGFRGWGMPNPRLGSGGVRSRVVRRGGVGNACQGSSDALAAAGGAACPPGDMQRGPVLTPARQSFGTICQGLSPGGNSSMSSPPPAAAAAMSSSPRPVGRSAAPAAAAATAAAAAAAGLPGGAGGSSSSSSKGVKRRRSRQPRRWTQIGNVFCDEQTGWVHVCDETCSEKIIEPSSGLLVCPISGTCSARLLTCAEEAAEEGDRDDEKDHREEDFGGERGRLARAFAAGYYCSDERELMRECGVYLPH